MDEPVRLTTVHDEQEAEIVCGLLRSAGIECGHRLTEETDSVLEEFQSGGPHEIVVHQSDLEAAQTLLTDVQN